jgi:hypothetical protein
MRSRRLTTGVGLALTLGLAAPAPASAQDAAAADAAVEACIRDNAARVEQAFESLTEATTFLVNSVCAKPAADAAKQEQTMRADRQRERLEAACAELSGQTDPLTRYNNPLAQQCDSLPYLEVYEDEVVEYGYYGGASPAMTSLAATLLLEARLARSAQD